MDTATLTALKNAHAKLTAMAALDPSCELEAKALEPVIARVTMLNEQLPTMEDAHYGAGSDLVFFVKFMSMRHQIPMDELDFEAVNSLTDLRKKAMVTTQSEEDRILNDMYLAAGNLNKLSIPPEKHAAMRPIVEGMKNALAMVEVPQGQDHVWLRAACAVFRLEDRFKEATPAETLPV